MCSGLMTSDQGSSTACGVRFWPFALFTLLLTVVLNPLVGHWTWGGGWLDCAGSTIVYFVGGWAALAGIWGTLAVVLSNPDASVL